MTTVVCHNCHRENMAGRGFCQFCGSRLTLSPKEADPDEARHPKEALPGGERTIAGLKHELEVAKQELAAAQDELKAVKQEEHLDEKARLRDSLAESEKNAAALRSELEAARSLVAEGEGQLKEHLAAREQAIDAVKGELDLAREKAVTGLNERLVAGEQAIASLKQEHASAIAKVATVHRENIAQRDALIGELNAKLQGFSELEKKQLSAGLAIASGEPAQQGTTNRRGFGAMAMTIAAILFSGAGGVGGYFYRGNTGSSQKDNQAVIMDLRTKIEEVTKLNRDLEERLRSQHEAYERVNEDLKQAEDRLKVQTTATPGTSANDDLQKKLEAAEAELARRQQEIDALKAEEAQQPQPQESAPHDTKESHDIKEVRPKPRQTIDFDTTIRNLEREYGIPRIGR